MKKIVFDTSSIISIVTNNLLGTLKLLKKKFDVEFYVPNSVKVELIDDALATQRFKLEAIMLSRAIRENVIKVYPSLDVDKLLKIANNTLYIEDTPLHILDKGEVEALALASKIKADAYCVDERTMRLIVENPEGLKKILSNKLQKDVFLNKNNINDFKKMINEVPFIRSVEIMIIAFENGLLDKYISNDTPKALVLEALLFGLRMRGCSISNDDIDEIIRLESR